MQIVYKKLDEIKPYEKNPRNNEGAVQYVANSIREFGFKVPIVIDKYGEIVAGHTRQTTVLEFDRPSRSAEHPTMKPVPLFDYQIKNSSKKGDAVLDLFGGSGTTIVCCEQNGRDAYLMELDPKYVDVIIDRYEKLTGDKAVLLTKEEESNV